MIQISINQFKAAIFDMDGTMINNTEHHQKAWQEFLKRHDINLTEEEFKEKISGKKNSQILNIVFERELSQEESDKYAQEKESIYRELYKPDIQEINGLTNTINKLQELGIKTAIATTAPAANREFALESLNLQGKFEVILGDEHVEHGKPHPEIYLSAAEKLGVNPQECLVFEDSPVGIAAGKAAGMAVVGILTYHKPEELTEANLVVQDFEDIEFIT
jgi:beta-phosphoglucomutase family hydrolase